MSRRTLLSCACAALLLQACTGEKTPVDLAAAERSEFSQAGEDGVLEKVFEIIPPGPKFAVEFGAGDGRSLCNVRNLILKHGWSALLIEGDAELAARLEENYAEQPRVTAQHAWVYPGNIELLFEEAGVPTDLDLLVIDIDSNDYYVWRAIRDFRPKVVLIEVNPFFPPPQRMVVDFHPMNYWDGSDYFGASLESLNALAKKKGYELVYHMKSGINAVFVAKEYYDRFGLDDNSPAALFSPPNQTWKEVIPRSPGGGEAGRYVAKDSLPWDAFSVKKQFRFDR